MTDGIDPVPGPYVPQNPWLYDYARDDPDLRDPDAPPVPDLNAMDGAFEADAAEELEPPENRSGVAADAVTVALDAAAADAATAPILDPVAPKVTPHWTLPTAFRPKKRAGGRYVGSDVIGDPGSLLEVEHRPAKTVVGGHRSGAAVDVMEVGDIVVGAVSIRGASHYDSATVRQDAHALGMSVDGRHLIAVIADGVGSGDLSHLGAEWACQQGVVLTRKAVEQAGGDVDGVPWAELSESLRMTVRDRAVQHLGAGFTATDGTKADPKLVSDQQYAKMMGTTAEIMIVDVSPGPDGGHVATRVVIAGDGTGLVLDPNKGWWRWGLKKVGGDESIASNAVRPLPIDTGPPAVSSWVLEPGQAVVVATDGFGDPLGDGATPVGGYLHGAWATPIRSAPEFLRSASFIRLHADDDRTAVVVWACSS